MRFIARFLWGGAYLFNVISPSKFSAKLVLHQKNFREIKLTRRAGHTQNTTKNTLAVFN